MMTKKNYPALLHCFIFIAFLAKCAVIKAQGQNSTSVIAPAAAVRGLTEATRSAQQQPVIHSTAAAAIDSTEQLGSRTDFDVVIVGAGMAGVAAARQLADAPAAGPVRRRRVLLVEARNRPGGRLHSVETAAGAVDLGAMWIHEAGPGNALYELAQQQGVNISRPHDYGSASVFMPDGRPANMFAYGMVYSAFMSQVRGRIAAMRAAAALIANATSVQSISSTSSGSHSSNNVGNLADSLSYARNSSSTSGSSSGSSSNSDDGRVDINATSGAASRSDAAVSSAVTADRDVPLSELFSHFVESNRAHWRPEQVPLANLVMHTQFQTLLNANITELSSLRFGDAKTLPNVDVLLKPGFGSLVKQMLPGLDIGYNTTITHITQNSSSVTLTTANGINMTAAHVLVTLPLGVLKAGSVKWSPPLPTAKQAAISAMGMGVLDKLVLVFPDDGVFWNKQSDFIAVAPPDWSGRWSIWLNYYKVWKVSVLVALNPADTAASLEAMTDGEVVAEALQVLCRIYGTNAASSNLGNSSSSSSDHSISSSTNSTTNSITSSSTSSSSSSSNHQCGGQLMLPGPTEAFVTHWKADPFARGSYSFFATDNSLNITDELAAPFQRVLFAGEATSKKSATVLGALLSGRREVARLLGGLQL